MVTTNLYDHTGKKTQSLTLPKEVFAAKINHQLVAQAIHVLRTNQAQHNSAAKTRGEVSFTKAKAYRQKGTGRARHGAKSAPIFVGGGVAHGPKAIKPARKRLNTKMRRLSLIHALSSLTKQNAVSLVANLDKLPPKTSHLQKLLAQAVPAKTAKILLITSQAYPDLIKAAKNINNLSVSHYRLINIYQLLNHHHLLLDQSSLEPISLWLTGKTLSAKTTPSAKKPPRLPQKTKK